MTELGDVSPVAVSIIRRIRSPSRGRGRSPRPCSVSPPCGQSRPAWGFLELMMELGDGR